MNLSSGQILIRGGALHDGLGNEPQRGDLLIDGGRIVAMGSDLPLPASPRRMLDASGMAVCPGFIDIHSHSDLALLHPDSLQLLAPFLQQGITTQVIGNCGLGVAPVAAAHRSELIDFMTLITPPGINWRWESFAEYLQLLEDAPPPLNAVPLVAHGALRCAAMGNTPGPARNGALETIVGELQTTLEAGAVGLSAGLIYPPGLWADTDELMALCEIVAATGKLFCCHVRGCSELALDAERELLYLAERTGVRVQHSHHEAFGAPYWHLARSTLRMEEEARQRGIDIASDVIPYHAVNTTLLAIYPPWTLVGGFGSLFERLADPESRSKIERQVHDRVPEWPPWEDGWAHNLVRATGWENIVLLQAGSSHHGAWLGHSLAAIAAAEGRPAFECAAEITVASSGNVMARYHAVSGAPDDDGVLQQLLSHPDHAVGVDVILKGDGVPHPGGYGAMPRLLGHYARQRRWFGLADAIRKVTSLPAARIGLSDRGCLRPGAAADVVVFDPHRIGEQGTYEVPDRLPEGLVWVLVNGVPVVQQGQLTGEQAGQVLRTTRSRA